MLRLKPALVAAVSSISLFAVIPSASAESVAQALASAYADNPEINSARAQTRSDDENVAIARSGRLPNVSIDNQTTWQTTDIAPRYSDTTRSCARSPIRISLLADEPIPQVASSSFRRLSKAAPTWRRKIEPR